jgi:hypothetical protein
MYHSQLVNPNLLYGVKSLGGWSLSSSCMDASCTHIFGFGYGMELTTVSVVFS